MKFIRVNMTDKSVEYQDMPEHYNGLGGRGLTSILINDEVNPQCDPLGPDNKLIYAPGLLSATALVNTGRLSIGAKSPLTGGIKESNVGGTMAKALANLDMAALIVEGKAPEGELSIIRIDSTGAVALVDAGAYKGMRTYALVEKLKSQFGDKVSIACVGPAGEYLYRSASIQVTDVDGRPCRAAGRGGLGAVMASKGIKGLVVDRSGRQALPMADPEGFKTAAKSVAGMIAAHPFSGQALPNLGTAAMLGPVNSAGAFPCYNATKGRMEDWEKISGETLARLIGQRGGQTAHSGCTGCVARCSNVFVDEQGKYVTSSLEYETIWSMGGMTGITDLDVIARLDFLCDDIGLDAMNTGVAVAVAMDAGYREFGDTRAALQLIEQTAENTGMGRLIGDGPAAVGEYFGHHRVPVVKNQSIAAYDPRGIQGNGVTYATSPMGADHTAGNLVGASLAGLIDPLSAEGQTLASRNAQIAMAALDNSGLCLLVGMAVAQPEGQALMTRVTKASLGEKALPDGQQALGIRILKAERAFNTRAGLTEKDDRLPEFFKNEPLPPHNKPFLVPDEDLDKVHFYVEPL